MLENILVFFKALKSLFAGLWRVLDSLRKGLQLLLLLVIAIVFLASITPDDLIEPREAVLVVSPQGVLVDQLSGDAFERAAAEIRGLPLNETLLRDLIEVIRIARDDERIEVLVLQLDGLVGSGLSKLQELSGEIVRFKQSGKPVIAVGDWFTRDQYYIAAHADKIYMNPCLLYTSPSPRDATLSRIPESA